MAQTFNLESLTHIAQCAVDGDDTDADTVCIMAADLARALKIEEAVVDFLGTSNLLSVEVFDKKRRALEQALAATAEDLADEDDLDYGP